MANNFPNILPSFNADFVNGIYVDPRITFTRAGTRTYYGQEVVKAEENLLLQSQTFDNAAWTKTRLSVTANTTAAPDGTTTAETLTATAVNDSHFINCAVSFAGQQVISVFAKAGTLDFIQIAGGGDVQYFANFDLSLGVTGTSGTKTTASITAFADGWYRCVVLLDGSSTVTGVNFVLVGSDSAARFAFLNAAGTETVFLWGAQLEQRSFVTAYTPTTTQPITRYQRQLKTAAANEWPREFNPVTGECLGRSVWESRTNLLLRSEELDNASWAKVAAGDGVIPVVTANQTIAPDGTLSADRVDFVRVTASAGNSSLINSNSNTVTAISYFGTVYIKAATTADVGKQLNFRHVSAGAFLVVTLTADWQLVGRVETGVAGSRFMQIGISETLPQTSVSAFIWGAQVEAGAFATPYIPTVASQVTRVADSAVMTGVNFSSWFNPSEGTLFADANSVAGGAFRSTLRATDSAANNFVELGMVTGTNNGQGRYQVNYAGASQVDTGNVSSPAFVANTFYKNAASYKVNDFSISRDGAAVVVDTVGSVPLGLDRLELGGRHITSASLLNGYIKRLTYYPQALTAANLQAITR